MTHLLFGKTHIHACGVRLDSADLSVAAQEVARALGVPGDKVWAVYVGEDQIDFDVMVESVRLEGWSGAQSALIAALSAVEGITVREDAYVTGDGILGSVGWEGRGEPASTSGPTLAERVQAARRSRASIWSTGAELLAGRIKDQNAPYLESIARTASIKVTVEGVLADSPAAIVTGIERSLGLGAGWVITSGGIGRGPGDHTLAAVARLDPALAHVPAVTFQHGDHRYAVEIGVGVCEGCYVIALPGPHDEVRACGPVLRDTFGGAYPGKWEIAAALADAVGALFKARHDSSGR